jgi:hypothetical protein
LSVYDTDNEAKLADYSPDESVGLVLACYTPSGLTFIESKEGKLALVHSSPHLHEDEVERS